MQRVREINTMDGTKPDADNMGRRAIQMATPSEFREAIRRPVATTKRFEYMTGDGCPGCLEGKLQVSTARYAGNINRATASCACGWFAKEGLS